MTVSTADFEKFIKKNEDRLQAFGQRIGDVQLLKDEVKSLRAALDHKDSVMLGMKAALDAVSNTVKTHSETLLDHTNLVADVKNTLNVGHQDFKKALDLTRATISEVGVAHCSTASKIVDLRQQITGLSSLKRDLDSHKEDLESFKQSTSSQIDNVRSVVQKFFNETSALKSDVSRVTDFKATYEADRTAMTAAMKKAFDSVVSSTKEDSSAIASKIVSLQQEWGDKLSAIKVPDIKNVASSDRVAKIESQIESIALDAKNAFLKAGNVDMQTQLHNKKIENIQLLLKQHELTK